MKTKRSKWTMKVSWRYFLSLALMLTFYCSNAQNFPFPQNYQYQYGSIYKGTNVSTTLQTLYSNWKADYYEESGNYGRVKFVQVGESGANTVSEGIAYGMLITVYMDNATNNTKSMFDKLWAYYQLNKNSNGFMNWKVVGFTGSVAPGGNNANGATDADIDVATALLLAHKQWGSGSTSTYKTAADDMMNKIWMYEVNSSKMLKPGDMFDDYKNPCYFITNGLGLFNATDPVSSHDWASVITNSYSYMAQVANTTTGLMPDWANNNGTLISGIVNDKFESYYLYDAIRIPWRLAHAYAWYGDAQALTLGSKITDWAITNFSGNLSSVVDGYLLNGSVFNNPTGNAGFTTLGKSKNPCVAGAMGMGAMLKSTSNYASLLQNAWSEGAKTDPYGHYYTETTQLLFMLTLSGNMPNFWNMTPEFVSAETNTTGNKVLVAFSKSILSSSIAGALSGFTIKYGNGTLTATASSGTLLADGKTVELTLNKDITEPIISISYNGTASLKGIENDVVKAFTDKVVTDKILNGKPVAINLLTNNLGTQVLILMSKDMSLASLTKANFSVSVGGVLQVPSTVELDATNPAIVILTLTTPIANAAVVITCSYTKGTMASTGGGLADSFTARTVTNYTASVTCSVLESFDPATLAWAKWASDATFNATATTTGNTTKCGYFSEGMLQAYSNLKAEGIADFAASMKANPIFKVKVKVSAACDVRFRFYNKLIAPDYNDAGQIIKTFTITAAQANTWLDLEADLSSVVPGISYIMNGIEIALSPNVAGGQTIYFDDLQFCPPAPVVKVVSGRTNYMGDKVEVKFNTPLSKPADLSGFSLLVGGVAATITGVDYKQGDQTYLVFSISPKIVSNTSVVTMSYSGTSVKTMDNRSLSAFTGQKIINMFGLATVPGWRDDFAIATDVINMASVAPAFVQSEITTGVAGSSDGGAWNVVADGTLFWQTMGPVETTKVWDLSANPIVKIKYKVTGTAPLYIRVDLKDYANSRTTDAITEVLMTSDGAWHEYTFNFTGKFTNQYGASPGDVDKTNIVQALIYLWKEASSAANTYKPATFLGTVQFDYISIGTEIILSGVTSSVNEGSPVAATSNVTGKIYLVPYTTPQVLDQIQEAITAQKGVSVISTASVAASIPTTGLVPGSYIAYAFDDNTGGLSNGKSVNILDITKPILLNADNGSLPINSYVNATVNEKSNIYIVPSATAADKASILFAAKTTQNATANTPVQMNLVSSKYTVGLTYLIYAIDDAGNVSLPSDIITVIAEVIPAPVITEYPLDSVSITQNFNVTVNKTAMLYIVPTGTPIANKADVVAGAVMFIGVSPNIAATLPATTLEIRSYYAIAIDDLDQFSNVVIIKIKDSNVGISDNSKNQVSVSPVPMKDVLNVTATAIEHIEIYNANGQLIDMQKGHNASTIKINTTDFATGIYFVKVYTNTGMYKVKAVK